MHFREEDVHRLLDQLPCLRLAKRSSAQHFIESLARDADELQHVLLAYPAIRYEPLESHYAVLRCLGALNEALIADLCQHHSWRGVVCAAFLTALLPDERFVPALQDAMNKAPESRWLVDLALAEATGATSASEGAFLPSVRRLRQLLRRVPRPVAKLRPAPSAHEVEQWALYRDELRRIYRERGARAAWQVIEERRNVDREQST